MSGIPQGGAFQRALPDDVGLGTLGVRGGLMRTGFEETSEALFLNSGFVYESAEAAEQAKRERNRAHKAKINSAALAAFVAGGMTEECAKMAVTLIASGKIPAVAIAY